MSELEATFVRAKVDGLAAVEFVEDCWVVMSALPRPLTLRRGRRHFVVPPPQVSVGFASDDALIFGNVASDEFLTLYRSGLFTAAEIDALRLNGLAD